MRIGRIGRLLAPSYGQCERCHTPWRFTPCHVTPVPNTEGGVFALCEPCWEETVWWERVPFYLSARARNSWNLTPDQVETAVWLEPAP